MALADNLNTLMRERQMTQADLARATGLGTAQIAYLVNGRTVDPRLSTAVKLAQALDCCLEELVGAQPIAIGRVPQRVSTECVVPGIADSPAFHAQGLYRDMLAMYKGRTETLLERRLAESLKSLMRTRQLDSITVSEICRAAQVGRRSFYRHFMDKYDLLTWTFYQDICLKIEHHATWTAWDYIPVICTLLEQDRAFYRNAFLVQGPNSVREFACARMFPLAMPDFTSLGIDKVQLETYVNRLIGIVADSIEFWLIEEPDLPAATFARRFRQKMTRLSRRTLETLIADAPS